MSFVPGDPTFEEHMMMPQYRPYLAEDKVTKTLPHQGWQAPATWTIWPHLDYEDLSRTMTKGLHKFERLSDLEKCRISSENDSYIPETQPGQLIKQALDEEVRKREREAQIQRENEEIERKVLEESARRWKKRNAQESAREQEQWLSWWNDWRLREAERKEKLRDHSKWQLNDKDALTRIEYSQLRAMAESGAGDVVKYDKNILEAMGLTQQQFEALERKLELDRMSLEERKDAKRQEYEEFLEPQKINRSYCTSVYYIHHDEITLWKKPFIYTVPHSHLKNPRDFTKSHWNFIKKKLPTTSPIMNEWGDMAWRFVHGLNFKTKFEEMKYRKVFLEWANGHMSEKVEPVPRELFVFSQMVTCADSIPRKDFQKVINLFGSRGYFEEPVYNRRFEEMSSEEREKRELCPVNACPFIELSNYFGAQPNCRKTAWYFNWHFYKLKNVYLHRFNKAVYRLYEDILNPGHTPFVCKGKEVVEYLNDDWDGYLRPNYRTPQRVLLFKNRNEDYPLEFYHDIVHRLAAEQNWIIGIPHWEAGRYVFNFIHYGYITRHVLSALGIFVIYIGRYHPSCNILFTTATIIQILGALFYRIYFDGNHLIDYDYFPNIFHYHYSPIQHDPEQYFTQFFENKANSYKKFIERRLYRFMTAVTMFYAFYRFCWPEVAICTLPCDMVPSHPYPYHPEGLGPGWFTFDDWPKQYPPPQYTAKDVALARQPFLNPTEKSIAITGGLVTVGIAVGAIVCFLYVSY